MKSITEDFCEAEVNTYEEAGVMPWLTCLADPGHEGEHYTTCFAPCKTCGGFDLHYDDCSDIGETANNIVSLKLRFDDDGWIRCEGVW